MNIRPFVLTLFTATCLRAGPVLFCPEPSWNGGRQEVGTEVRHAFTLENRGDAPLKLVQAGAGCSRVTGHLPKNELLPGESTELSVAFQLPRRRGPVRRFIQLGTNDPACPKFDLRMEVDFADDFELDTSFLDLDVIPVGSGAAYQANLRVVSTNLYRVTQLVAKNGIAKLALDTSPDQKTHAISLEISPQATPGTVLEEVEIHTDNPRTPLLTLQVVGSVQSGLVVAPREIAVRSGSNPVSRLVAIQPGWVKSFTITSATFEDPSAAVEVQPSFGGRQIVRVRFDSVPASAWGKHLVIRTDAPGYEEIRIPLREISLAE